MNSNSAVVTSLVAEVRVLMVGSRQITLSVFRQLDVVDYETCDPMGRVNDSRGDYEMYWIVGRDSDGNLVRACLDDPPRGWTPRDAQELRNCELELKYRETEHARQKFLELETLKANVPIWRNEWQKRKNDYDALPLIVLAGLK